MGKGLGIAALVIGIISILVPVITLYVVWLALILAAVAGYGGEKTYSVATIAICLVNLLFLSPSTWLALTGENIAGGSFLLIGTIIMFIAPIAALVLRSKKEKSEQMEKKEQVA